MNDVKGKQQQQQTETNKIISLRNNQCTLRAEHVHTQSEADRRRKSSTAHSALKRLHSTESCLHPHISAHIGGVQRGRNHTEEKENSWGRFLRLNASVSQVCGTVTSRWGRGHTNIAPANRWPFSGTDAKSHRGGSRAEEYGEEGKEEDQVGKTQQLKGNRRG